MTATPTPVMPDEVLEIARTLESAGYEAWCVGGALRDALLGHPHTDYDFATSATPAQVMALFRHTAPVARNTGPSACWTAAGCCTRSPPSAVT